MQIQVKKCIRTYKRVHYLQLFCKHIDILPDFHKFMAQCTGHSYSE